MGFPRCLFIPHRGLVYIKIRHLLSFLQTGLMLCGTHPKALGAFEEKLVLVKELLQYRILLFAAMVGE